MSWCRPNGRRAIGRVDVRSATIKGAPQGAEESGAKQAVGQLATAHRYDTFGIQFSSWFVAAARSEYCCVRTQEEIVGSARRGVGCADGLQAHVHTTM